MRRNRHLRAALLRMAHCLNCHNVYFMGIAEQYCQRHPDGDDKVPIARSFSRLSYYVLAGEQLISHKALQSREKVMQKLLLFYGSRNAEPSRTSAALIAAMSQMPVCALREERSALSQQYAQVKTKRRTRGVKRLVEILPVVLMRLDERLVTGETPKSPNTSNMIQEDETHGS